jgi:hypothetical protein
MFFVFFLGCEKTTEQDNADGTCGEAGEAQKVETGQFFLN